MKYAILIKMLFYMLAHRKVTAKDLSNRFNISIRTVYRYMDVLSMAVPIYNERSRNGGFIIYDSCKIPATLLTEDEKNLVITTLNGIVEETSSPMLTEAIEKIGAICGKQQGDYSVNFSNLIIDCSSWGNTDYSKETLSIIVEGLEKHLAVNIKYTSQNGKETEREIYPYAMFLKEGLWYTYAYCNLRKSFRLFKLGRISACLLTKNKFTRQENVNVSEVIKEWYESLDAIEFELLVDKEVRADVEEWLGVKNVFESQGEIKAQAKLPKNNELIAKILSFRNKVKVLSPKTLKQDIITAVKEINNLYK